MRVLVTRRKLIQGSVPAALIVSARSDGRDEPIDMQADAPPNASSWSQLRETIAQLRSAAGASLVGFIRRDTGARARSVGSKLSEFPSITDFGAVGDDRTDDSAAIQRGIDAVWAAGGGSLLIPTGTFRIERRLILRPKAGLQGMGASSVLHLVNNNRADALHGEGSATVRLSKIAIRDLAILGDARFRNGAPGIINGSAIAFVYADDCEVTGVTVVGFSDNGITFLNGSRNSVTNCRVEQTAQGISFTANDISVDGNVAIGNRIFDTGEYNGLHLEGGFGGHSRGEVRNTSLIGNTVAGSWEAGINIELAPGTSCVGNTVQRSGLGKTAIGMGIKVYGGYRSAVSGNTVTDSSGYGIVIGANSGDCAVSGNVTAGNAGSLLLTDSGAQVTNDVTIGSNSFAEGDIQTSGNVRIRNRTTGLSLANRATADPQTLDWYEEGRFTPLLEGRGAIRVAGDPAAEGRYTRVGNVVHFSLQVAWGARGTGSIAIQGLPFLAASDTPLTALLRPVGSRSGGLIPIGAVMSGNRVLLQPFHQSQNSGGEALSLLVQGEYLAIE